MRGLSFWLAAALPAAVPGAASAAPAHVAAAVANTSARTLDNVKLEAARRTVDLFDEKSRCKTDRFIFRLRRHQ